jgi:ankyrin repeat protein
VTGETALFFVATKGKEDLVRKMLDQGADPNAKNQVRIL